MTVSNLNSVPGDFWAQWIEILSVTKSNRLHVDDIFQFFIMKLEYIFFRFL